MNREDRFMIQIRYHPTENEGKSKQEIQKTGQSERECEPKRSRRTEN